MFILLALMLVGVVFISLLLLKLRQSLLAGYFICGAIIANTGIIELLGGGSTEGGIQQMSEFGVMLLMFTLGLEFSLSDVRYVRRLAFLGGGWQMALCGVAAAAGAFAAGFSGSGIILVAVALAMSSTAVSLKSFQEMGQESSPGAQMALAVALFQDLFVILFFLALPVLLNAAPVEGGLLWQVGSLLLRGGLFVLLAGASARWIIPALLHAVTRTRNRELFTLCVVGCCVGLAFIGGILDLGLALGAFVAGLAVSESVYKPRILADISPLRDLFLTLFFISVGLMVDLRVALHYWHLVLGLTLLLMVVKATLIFFIAQRLGLAHKQALMAGLGLSSAGEFSLVLLQKAGQSALWSTDVQQVLICSAALSMGLLPALMKGGEPLHAQLEKLGWGKRKTRQADSTLLTVKMKGLSDHAIIIGYGPVGERLNKSLLAQGVTTLVIDLNAETARRLKRQGQPVLFADSAHHETWELCRLNTARLVAFTFPDAPSIAESLSIVRELRPDVAVLARARFASDVERLKRLGASVVVNDELEAGRSIVEQALIMQG